MEGRIYPSYLECVQEIYRTLEEARTKKETYYSIPYGYKAPRANELDEIAGEYLARHASDYSCMESAPRQWARIVWKE